MRIDSRDLKIVLGRRGARAIPRGHPRGGGPARAARGMIMMARCGVLLFLVCASTCLDGGTGRVSSIVCGDCATALGGCSHGCPVERVADSSQESAGYKLSLYALGARWSGWARGAGEALLPSPWQAFLGMFGLGLLQMEWFFVSDALRLKERPIFDGTWKEAKRELSEAVEQVAAWDNDLRTAANNYFLTRYTWCTTCVLTAAFF